MKNSIWKPKWTSVLMVCSVILFLLFWTLYEGDLGSRSASSEVLKEDNKVDIKDQSINFPNSLSTKNIPFSFFDKSLIYDSTGISVDSFSSEQKVLIQKAIYPAARKIGSKFSHFEFGNYRLLGSGVEFQLFFKGANSSVSQKVSLLKRFAKPLRINNILYSNEKVVNIVIPLQGRSEVLVLFLDNLINHVIPFDSHLTLTVVYFKDENSSKTKSILQYKLRNSPSFKWSFVLVEDSKFSRGKGLKIGVDRSTNKSSDLIFFCDVDIFLKPAFFKRCRANSIESYQVYYPIVFSLYNPQVVYSLKQDAIPPLEDQLSVDANHGFWRYFGFGMACMHRQEFDAVGGIPQLKTWGGEDNILFDHLVSLETLKIIRAPDTALFHIYHPKNCDRLDSTIYTSCVRSKAATEGNQMQLGLLVLKLREGVDIEGALYSWKREYKIIILLTSMGLMMCLFIIIFQQVALRRSTAGKSSKCSRLF